MIDQELYHAVKKLIEARYPIGWGVQQPLV